MMKMTITNRRDIQSRNLEQSLDDLDMYFYFVQAALDSKAACIQCIFNHSMQKIMKKLY